MLEEEFDETMSIFVVGDGGVGKSTLLKFKAKVIKKPACACLCNVHSRRGSYRDAELCRRAQFVH